VFDDHSPALHGDHLAWIKDTPACSDGFDNDGDGLVDHVEDPGCNGDLHRDLENPPCQDGLDNDNDGAVDLDDPGCVSPVDVTERCGLGFELVLLAPVLWRRMRRRSS